MGRPKGAKDKAPRKQREDDHKPWLKSPIIQGHDPEVPEGYNSKMVAFLTDILPTEPLDYHDVDEMERRFKRYLQKCVEWDMKVGNMAAYMAIGINKDTAWDWEHVNKVNPRRALFIKKVRQFCAVCRENLMQDGKVNPVTGIFWQKNYDGLRDQQEVVLTPNVNPLGEAADAEALKQKYLTSTYGVAEAPVSLPEAAEGQILIEAAESPQKASESLRNAQKGAEGAMVAPLPT